MKVRVIRVHGRRALGLGRLLLGLAPLDDLVTVGLDGEQEDGPSFLALDGESNNRVDIIIFFVADGENVTHGAVAVRVVQRGEHHARIVLVRLMAKSGAVVEGVREATGQDASKTEVFLYHMPEYEIEFTQAVMAYTKISLDVHGQNKRCRALFVRKAMWKCAGEFKLKEEADRKASMFAM